MQDEKPSTSRPLRVFISAAEQSGDQHAAELIRRIRQLRPDAQFAGVAGLQMQAAGCLAIEDWTRQAAMLTSAFKLIGKARELLNKVEDHLDEYPADIAVLVDSPALHLPMAKRLRHFDCPVLYYIAPQLWAWAPWRIRKVRKFVDKLSAILPFEQAYFRERGVDTHFVGHPLIAQLGGRPIDTHEVQNLRDMGSPIVACLPGSRSHVIDEVLPGQIEVIRAIAARHHRAVFVFPAANDDAAAKIRKAINGERVPHRVAVGRNAEFLTAADFALVASGTATLEVAYYRVPMIVMYNAPQWPYRLLGRWLIRTEHLSLVNILAGKRAVPEFMPYYKSSGPIAAEALAMLSKPERCEDMREELAAIIASLGEGDAALATAQMAIEMAGVKAQPLGKPAENTLDHPASARTT